MTAQAHQPTEATTEKLQYRVTNWPEYDRALVLGLKDSRATRNNITKVIRNSLVIVC